jgi:hypothetical protein
MHLGLLVRAVEEQLTVSTFDIGDWLERRANPLLAQLSSVLPLARQLPYQERDVPKNKGSSRNLKEIIACICEIQ